MSNLQDLMKSMREANSIAKTAREHTKTASAGDDLSARGDLLSNTIHRITAETEERVFPEEVRLRKEAALKKVAAEETPKADAEETPKADAAETTEKSETTEETSEVEETKEASHLDALALHNNPLVKRGFDEYMREHNDEFRRCVSEIISSAAVA